MRYASDVIGLLAPYPGRDFRMNAIVRYVVGASSDHRTRKAVREGVRQVMKYLCETGMVDVTPAKGRGGFALYRWKQAEPVKRQA